jgi:hypothetical protein
VVTLANEVRPEAARGPARPLAIATLGAACALVTVVLLTAEHGPGGRILADRSVESYPQLWGYHHWITTVQIATLIASSLFLTHFVLWSRRHGRLHPALPVLAGLFVMGGLTDAFANWTSSAAMNPELLHFPTSWSFFDVSPTVEPIINTVAYPYLFIFPALAITSLFARRTTTLPRPLRTVFGVTFAVAIPINWVLVNLFMCRIEYWTYTQIPGWAAIRGQTPWQYPWTDPLTLSVLTGLTAVLLQRAPDGSRVGTRIASRIRILRHRPVAGEIAVAVLITALGYVPYNAVWASYRLTNSGDTLAPWVYANTKVYDPKGDYARAGVPGPYFRGMWP